MPAIVDGFILDSPFIDRRTKMLPCQKERCFQMHHYEGFGIRPLARMFNVDKRLIQFICYPERKKKNLQDRFARGGSTQYYDREKNTAAMHDHREHKKKILTNRKK